MGGNIMAWKSYKSIGEYGRMEGWNNGRMEFEYDKGRGFSRNIKGGT